MSDGQRDRVRRRHSELALGLAGLARGDRDAQFGLLPADDRRAVVLGLFARLCEQREVAGWRERFVRVLNADSALYRSLVFEFETAGTFTMNPKMRVDLLPENSDERVAEMRLDDLVNIECKRLDRMVIGSREHHFAVEIFGPVCNADLTLIVDTARNLDWDGEAVHIQRDGGRINCSFASKPVFPRRPANQLRTGVY